MEITGLDIVELYAKNKKELADIMLCERLMQVISELSPEKLASDLKGVSFIPSKGILEITISVKLKETILPK